MRVTIEYMTQVRRAVGIGNETIDWPGGTLADLIHVVAGKHPEAASLLLDCAGRPSRAMLAFINNEPAAIDTAILDGARVTMMTPMAGG
jgi:molybdopterin converting factor small subunit